MFSNNYGSMKGFESGMVDDYTDLQMIEFQSQGRQDRLPTLEVGGMKRVQSSPVYPCPSQLSRTNRSFPRGRVSSRVYSWSELGLDTPVYTTLIEYSYHEL